MGWSNEEDTFPEGICSKVNVIARPEFELGKYDVTVQYVNHYVQWTPTGLGNNHKGSEQSANGIRLIFLSFFNLENQIKNPLINISF